MCANVTRVPYFRVWGVLIVCGFGAGCHQPYQPNYYHQPGMYGQPLPQAQPGMQQMQPGMQQMQPGMQYMQPMQPGMQPGMQPMPPGQFAPGISSMPNDTFYTPQPQGQPMAPSPGGDAPAFGNPGVQPNQGGNSGSGQGVPRYNDPTNNESPYFERSSQRQPTFGAPATAGLAAVSSGQGLGNQTGQPGADEFSGTSGVATAEFAREETARAEIDLTGSVSFGSYGQFEPPIERPSPRAVFDPAETSQQAARPMASPAQIHSSELDSDPFATGRESTPATTQHIPDSHTTPEPRQPRPSTNLFELAAPPLDDEPTPAGGGVLEGVVRRASGSQGWVLTFPAGQGGEAPFGGQLPLTGKPEVLQSLRDGTPYQLRGVLETEDGDPPRARFHVNHVDSLGTPFAQPE